MELLMPKKKLYFKECIVSHQNKQIRRSVVSKRCAVNSHQVYGEPLNAFDSCHNWSVAGRHCKV